MNTSTNNTNNTNTFNINNLRMIFVTPLSKSMGSKKFQRNKDLALLLNELTKNNSHKRLNQNLDGNNTSKIKQ